MFAFFGAQPEDLYHTFLIHEILQGRRDKFGQLLEMYKETVYRIVYRRIPPERAFEVFQDAFVRAYFSLRTFKGIQPFKNWISRIASRACLDFWRKEYRNCEIPFSGVSDTVARWLSQIPDEASEDRIEMLADADEARELLGAVLGSLTPDDRMLVTLMYFDGKTVCEIAEVMDLSESNVKVRAMRARRKMRDSIERCVVRLTEGVGS